MSVNGTTRRPSLRSELWTGALLLALTALAGVLAGVVLHFVGEEAPARALWAVTTVLLVVPLSVSVARSLLRRDALRREPGDAR